MGQLRYYNEADIQRIADSARELLGTQSKFKVAELENALLMSKKSVPINCYGIYSKYFDNISPYRNGIQASDGSWTSYHTNYPTLTYEDGYDYQEYIFYGWYTDAMCTQRLNADKYSGGAYAKFVSNKNIAITFISSPYTPLNENGSADLRLAFPLPDLDLSAVGVYYSYNGSAYTFNWSSTAVKAISPSKDPDFFIFNDRLDSKYFFTANFTNIGAGNFAKYFTVSAAIRTYDNTIVIGPRNSYCVNDLLRTETNLISFPVIIPCLPSNIGNINFSVVYNPDKFEFYSVSNFSSKNAVDIDSATPGRLDISISDNINKEKVEKMDVYALLKFKVLTHRTPVINTLKVKNIHISDVNGKKIPVKLPDLYYYLPQFTYKGTAYASQPALFSLDRVDKGLQITVEDINIIDCSKF